LIRQPVRSREKWKTAHSERRNTTVRSNCAAVEKTRTAGPSSGSTTSRTTSGSVAFERSATTIATA